MTSLNPDPEDLTKASDAYLEQSLLSMQESVLRKTREINELHQKIHVCKVLSPWQMAELRLCSFTSPLCICNI